MVEMGIIDLHGKGRGAHCVLVRNPQMRQTGHRKKSE